MSKHLWYTTDVVDHPTINSYAHPRQVDVVLSEIEEAEAVENGVTVTTRTSKVVARWTYSPAARRSDAQARIDDARAYIAKTLDNVGGLVVEWHNHEVTSVLLDIMAMLEGRAGR